MHYLPYMNLRPFRVNAGGVHPYAPGPRPPPTSRISRPVRMCYAVNPGGRFREAMVGRIKVELRPLRLVEARCGDTTVNAFLQDDWHVRVMSAEGKPLNLTEVVPGSPGCSAGSLPSRAAVGIKVDEEISEF
ncbi:3-dehydroquinate synthase II [Streptomyces sp. L7]